MEITTREQAQLREIVMALVQDDQNWLEQQAIEVSRQGSFWILNYHPNPRTIYNHLTRGLVVECPEVDPPLTRSL